MMVLAFARSKLGWVAAGRDLTGPVTVAHVEWPTKELFAVKAWQLTGANEPLRRIDREDPRPGPGQAVLDVRAAGICHSDVGFIDGTLTPMLAKLPLVLGHEVAGVVAEVGPDGRSMSGSPTSSSARSPA